MDKCEENFSQLSLDGGGDKEESGKESSSWRSRASSSVVPKYGFPKMEDGNTPKSSRSTPYLVGFPKMSTSNIRNNKTPRRNPTTYTNQVQSESAEALPTVWEERLPVSGRSRSLNQIGISQQQQETNPHHRPGPANQRRSYNSGQTFNTRAEILRGLPRELYQKIIEEAPGTIITDYFCHGVTLARLHEDNIMESGMCQIVFLKNPETSQYWLKAFTKKTRSQEGNILKFNRALTPKFDVEFCGKTAFTIPPENNGNLSYFNEEKHIINFFDKAEAMRFNKALEKHTIQKKVQTHQYGPRSRQLCPSTQRKQFQSRPSSAGPGFYFQEHNDQDRNNFRMMDNNFDSNIGPIQSTPRFLAPRVQLYVKIGSGFALLGFGEISIISVPGGYDELIFRGRRDEVICDHRIYYWNEPQIVHQNSQWGCTWSAAANLLITINPKQIPTIHELKLVGGQQLILDFCAALQESLSRALAKRSMVETQLQGRAQAAARPTTSGI